MTKTTMNEYKREVSRALDDDFQRRMLESFAASYRVGRAAVFEGKDVRAAIADVAARKDDALRRRGELFARFRERAEELGVTVHRATDAPDACAIVARIAKDEGCRKIIKSKSMTAEEIRLNPALEREGFEVVESDLGEWILQLRNEGPSHMVMPAIHLSRGQVHEPSRRERRDSPRPTRTTSRPWFAWPAANCGVTSPRPIWAFPEPISAWPKTGAVGLVTNEGNARLVTTLPRVHVVLWRPRQACGTGGRRPDPAQRVAPQRHRPAPDLLYKLDTRGRPRRTGGRQAPRHACGVCGQRAVDLARDPVFSQVLRCVRCGACANVCPIYRMVGGHSLGQIYIGAIGLVLTWFFHDRERAKALLQNCVGCGACRDVCGAGINLPRLIEALRNRVAREDAPLSTALLAGILSSRRVFHGLLRAAAKAQGPFTGHLRLLCVIRRKSWPAPRIPSLARPGQRSLPRPLARPQARGHPDALQSGPVRGLSSRLCVSRATGRRARGVRPLWRGRGFSPGPTFLRPASDKCWAAHGGRRPGPSERPRLCPSQSI